MLAGKLYAVGGANDYLNFSSVERYDPASNAWEAVAPMTVERYAPGIAVLEGKLYAVGGVSDDDDGPIDTVERYDPAADVWEAVAPPLATARRFPFVASL